MKIDFLYHLPAGNETGEIVSEGELEKNIEIAYELLLDADAVLIGGGSGLSSSCGYNYYHNNAFFEEHFGTYREKYGFENLYSGLSYAYSTPEERWDFLSHYVNVMRSEPAGTAYELLSKVVAKKDYFIITTNIDGQFSKVFPEEKIWNFQGDVRYLQCSQPCSDEIYDNKEIMENLQKQSKHFAVPYDRIPRCPHCGRQLSLWVRDEAFLEGIEWELQRKRYQEFIARNQHKKVVLLEIGVGDMTPSIIKFPFWDMTQKQENVNLIIMNFEKKDAPEHIRDKSVVVCSDIQHALLKMKKCMEEKDNE